ncbi:IclR family transcriptional regulator [Parasphingorhabdus sp.]|uniref:IclR family transcriptional regulator n=1 Tax=Parasphingorhabdus sp. TaxID=2709688 RepID=UPI003A8D03E4
MATRQSSTLAKGLRLLQAIVADGGRSTLGDVAAEQEIPLPTAYRLAVTLEAEGYLERQSKGCYLPGREISRLMPLILRPKDRIAVRLRRPMKVLAAKYRVFMHFGVLEDGMVTYLVKENGGVLELFTEERMQLEAYCSGIGKILLAAMPEEELQAYLSTGPFPALTARTLTDPVAIRNELAAVREDGVAFDRFEIRDDIFCMALPVADPKGIVIGGLSVSFLDEIPDALKLASLRRSMTGLIKSALRKEFTTNEV